jgi:hypothetical protein
MRKKSAIAIPMIFGSTVTKKIISRRMITGNKGVIRPTVMETNKNMQEI